MSQTSDSSGAVNALLVRARISQDLEVKAAAMTQIHPAVSAPTSTTIIGIAVGVVGAMLLASAVVIVQIVRKRMAHKRAMALLEEGGVRDVTERTRGVRKIGDFPRPTLFPRKGSLLPAHCKAGWGALSSTEEIIGPDLSNHPSNRKRDSVSLPKRIKQGGIPLKRLKYLSAILESPRNRSARSPMPALGSEGALPVAKIRSRANSMAQGTATIIVEEVDVFTCPDSPKSHVLPSFAIRSPGRYGAIFNDQHNTQKTPRSVSLGALTMPDIRNAIFGKTRAERHARSISLGAHSLPPKGPVPPLPVIAPHGMGSDTARQGVCVSRMSVSSDESTGSSVLVTSPLLRGPDGSSSTQSPSLEQIVADDDTASLKDVSHRRWHQPLACDEHGNMLIPSSPPVPNITHRSSIHSSSVRYSTDSTLSRQRSSASTTASLDNNAHNRLSIPQIATVDRMSMSRVSSSASSFKSGSGISKVSTPRKVSLRRGNTVSATSSPAERRKSGILRDICGNACAPSRQASIATQDSTQSSNGDPFQWDSKPLRKPSAMKGSPNARKGHKRQNCVRISTLTPQILGPPPSQPTSPSIMHGIEEDGSSDRESDGVHGLPFVSAARRSRPPSSAFAPKLRVQSLRASLTPSSPTLSAWNAYQEHGLPSQHSDSLLSVSASPSTDIGAMKNTLAERASVQSMAFSLSAFPSPSKTTLAPVQCDQPVPEFWVTRPSTDEPTWGFEGLDEHSSVADHAANHGAEIMSSPPAQIPSANEYDPAWPLLHIASRTGSQEYDPASPAVVVQGAPVVDLSSPNVASTITFSDAASSPQSRPTSSAYQDTPPCSPKTMPAGFEAFFSGAATAKPASASASSIPRTIAEPLTSANASAHLASIISPSLDLANLPHLSPPRDYSPIPHSQPAQPLYIHRPIPTQNLRISSLSPSGPRPAPSKSVLQTTLALRRMNSEIDTSANRQSRRYIHGLTREPSPLLPFIGTPDLDAHGGIEGFFNFDFDPIDTAAGCGAAGALDEIGISDLGRQLDGAIGGFDVPEHEDGDDSGVQLEDDGEDLVLEEAELVPRGLRMGISVWEDGERFWQRISLSTIPGSSPGGIEVGFGVEVAGQDAQTPKKREGGEGWLKTRERERPVSIMATPKSLYDADGFLRSEG
ncbi:hypothetical protein B0A48_00887 [Cryoendolithus antarcticus]|uniref:Uncharacterized protein n=1 Tax=Cryoendolithus antarcticus TaxID=1507870 RepID=A0A1V8TS26_9PEZI|nr:hypothetical protein B0A48_00887 [Cryoendolithus antarcticus]